MLKDIKGEIGDSNFPFPRLAVLPKGEKEFARGTTVLEEVKGQRAQ